MEKDNMYRYINIFCIYLYKYISKKNIYFIYMYIYIFIMNSMEFATLFEVKGVTLWYVSTCNTVSIVLVPASQKVVNWRAYNKTCQVHGTAPFTVLPRYTSSILKISNPNLSMRRSFWKLVMLSFSYTAKACLLENGLVTRMSIESKVFRQGFFSPMCIKWMTGVQSYWHVLVGLILAEGIIWVFPKFGVSHNGWFIMGKTY